MAMTMHVDIVSAEESIFSGTCEFLAARTANGEVGILPRHSPMLVQLAPGEVRVRLQGGEERLIFVGGGMLEVQPHVLTVLADTAIRAKDLDEAQALEAKQRAEQALKDRNAEMDFAKAKSELAAAAAQLRVIQNLRARKKA